MTDVIIIGGGHNGLVCAAYLARAGKRVLVLEANDQVGGAAVTETFAGKYQVSACAHFLNQLDPAIEEELGLAIEPAFGQDQSILLAKDGRHTSFGAGDFDSAWWDGEDLQAWYDFQDDVEAFANALRSLLAGAPIDIFNADWSDKKLALQLGWDVRFGLGKDRMRELLRVIGMNVNDWLEERFEDPRLKGAIALDACMGHFAGPRSAGTVFNYLYRYATGGGTRVPKGGMGTVTKAMAKAASDAGAEIRTASPVDSVIVENCAAVGVRLAGGEEIRAGTVISNADPRRTVMDLVGPRHFEADFVRAISNVRQRGMTAKLHLTLDGMPDFKGLDGGELSSRMVMADTARNVERAFDYAKYGELPPKPMMELHMPTVDDPDLAPRGHHILSATIQFVPYHLKGGWSEGVKSDFRKRCIDRIAEYAPDIHQRIVAAELVTPADIESKYGLSGGHWHQGELALDQILMMRPVPGAARYALPLDGLYICGAGAHPGGGVMGVAGKLAAEAVLKGDG